MLNELSYFSFPMCFSMAVMSSVLWTLPRSTTATKTRREKLSLITEAEQALRRMGYSAQAEKAQLPEDSSEVFEVYLRDNLP